MAAQPGSALDRAARQLVAADLNEAARSGEKPLVLVGSAPLGAASDRPALFVQLQSARECGSAGCNTTAYLWRNNRWTRILDGVSGDIGIVPVRGRGMADITAGSERYAWNGTTYRDTRPAPEVNLRPRR